MFLKPSLFHISLVPVVCLMTLILSCLILVHLCYICIVHVHLYITLFSFLALLFSRVIQYFVFQTVRQVYRLLTVSQLTCHLEFFSNTKIHHHQLNIEPCFMSRTSSIIYFVTIFQRYSTQPFLFINNVCLCKQCYNSSFPTVSKMWFPSIHHNEVRDLTAELTMHIRNLPQCRS